MTREELRQRFRAENPEITDRVITDTVLNVWLQIANEEVGCETRCIMSNTPTVIDSIEDQQYYDLESNILRFFDIDDMPGGGVYYDDVPLTKKSAAEMNHIKRSWRTQDSGTPKYYWRRGKYLWFDKAPDDDDVEIAIDSILIPNSLTNDTQKPFNEIGNLQVYSEALSKYLQWRCKQKVGKQDEAVIAYNDYLKYVVWMKKRVKAAKLGSISIQPVV